MQDRSSLIVDISGGLIFIKVRENISLAPQSSITSKYALLTALLADLCHLFPRSESCFLAIGRSLLLVFIWLVVRVLAARCPCRSRLDRFPMVYRFFHLLMRSLLFRRLAKHFTNDGLERGLICDGLFGFEPHKQGLICNYQNYGSINSFRALGFESRKCNQLTLYRIFRCI